ncbi:hypothetical protein M082_1239 [Bacteroides fragilis str. 3725 D9 ii]|nr:hypothetical protein M082_1239 [Bacteroides fragilis str. 3725 D9 ii]
MLTLCLYCKISYPYLFIFDFTITEFTAVNFTAVKFAANDKVSNNFEI